MTFPTATTDDSIARHSMLVVPIIAPCAIREMSRMSINGKTQVQCLLAMIEIMGLFYWNRPHLAIIANCGSDGAAELSLNEASPDFHQM
jgi:hypothetical protein